MATPTTVEEVVERLRAIDASLPAGDGVAVFNRVYLTVTERIGALLAEGAPGFTDPPLVAELDVVFARLWLEAYDDVAGGRRAPAAWRPLFEARAARRYPIQFALAGMNAHIEHDLPLAVVTTCESRGVSPDELHQDYEAVNDVLAQVEAEIRRGFLTSVGQELDEHVGPVVHVISAWHIDKARDLSWVTAETLWALRRTTLLRGRFLDALGHTVGMTSRTLLAPTR
jgi:hypothetical protein